MSLFTMKNPFEDAQWPTLRRVFLRTYEDRKSEFDVDDPDTMYALLQDESSRWDPNTRDVDIIFEHVTILWMMDALEWNGPKVWVAGYNMPGYLPQPDAVRVFFHRLDAGAFIANEIEDAQSAWDDLDNETSPHTPFNPVMMANGRSLGAAARNLLVGDEVGLTIDGQHYWIRRRSISEASLESDFPQTP